MALANLEQFVAGQPDPEPTLCKLAENIKTTEILLHVFSTSQYLSEVLIRDPGLLGWLQAGAERPDREALIEDLWSSLSGASTEAHRALAIRRFRLRETLRIGYNDIVRGLPLEVITLDLSNLADACTEAATRAGAVVGRGPVRPACGPMAAPPGSSSWAWASSAALS